MTTSGETARNGGNGHAATWWVPTCGHLHIGRNEMTAHCPGDAAPSGGTHAD